MNSRIRICVPVGIMAALCCSVVAAQAPQALPQPAINEKPVWRWSTEERIEKRAASSTRVTPSRPGLNITGDATPELFMPWELMNVVLHGVRSAPAYRADFRASYRSRIAAFGWDPETFWNVIDVASARYASLAERRFASTSTRPKVALSSAEEYDSSVALCRARADALAAARTHYGGDAFDRFLYTVIAPSMAIGGAETDPSMLRFIERGCR